MDDDARRSGILAGQIALLGPAFRQRLARDRALLADLLADAERAGDAPSPAVRQIELCAHKLHGTSAMFGYVQLGEAAGHVESLAHEAAERGHGGARAARALAAPLRELNDWIDAAVAGTPEGGAPG